MTNPQQRPESPPARVSETTGLSRSQAHRNAVVERANYLIDEIAEHQAQLTVLRGSELRGKWQHFQSLIQTTNVTTAREQANAAVQNYTLEIMKLEGELATLKLALDHCDRMLTHYTWTDE